MPSVLAADIGHGAAGFTEVITKAGKGWAGITTLL
jgi:hypothetical protein